jgi:16S rRNA processing protein RimM
VSLPEPAWVTVALLGKPRGNRGEVTALAFSNKPERFQSLHDVYLFAGTHTGPRHFVVEQVWFHDRTLVFKFQGVDSISDAELLSRSEVRIPLAERAPLGAGEFFQSELIGCTVVERATGEPLGLVQDWDDAGGSGLLVLEGGMLIPFARSICVEIDPAARRIAVELPEGLKDLNRP